MASIGKKGGGDFVLESRHLVGLFLLLVVIFGAVFTLGYLMGRSQYDSKLRAAVDATTEASPAVVSKSAAKVAVEKTAPAQAQAGSDWEFYHSAEPKTAEDHLQPVKKTVTAGGAVASKPAAAVAKPPLTSASRTVPPLNAPLIPSGAIMVQVAALESENDALALAQALQQKKFPAFVIPAGADKYYRVQVGPYRDAQSAATARRDLEAHGFKSIVKR